MSGKHPARGRPNLGGRSPRVYLSGAAKRKKKQEEAESLQKQRESMLKHIKLSTDSQGTSQEQSSFSASAVSTVESDNDGVMEERNSDGSSDVESSPSDSEQPLITAECSQNPKIIFDDPALWPPMSNDVRAEIVKQGPVHIKEYDFPPTDGRKFTIESYYRKMQNNEKIFRSWLVYSCSQDSLFCFCCKLFSTSETKLVNEGFQAWQYVHKTLSSHERSSEHVDCMQKWRELESRLKTGTTIDRHDQQLIENEKLRWKAVLTRLLAIIQYLAERNMAFRGTSDRLFDKNNGNFLSQVELLAKFDPILSEHLRRVRDKEIFANYLGHRIQNEFISLLSEKILEVILQKRENAKYFSIILDCTPDISHKEQMTAVIRFVDIGVSAKIQEHFLGFVNVTDTTGAGLTESLLQLLNNLNINIADCRGQGYDNGSNMKGKNVGVQKRILDLNNRALYLPCGCHNLNLVISDAAKSSITAKSFFGYLQSVYVFFAASTSRWDVLKKHCKISLKSLSETRWECKINSVKTLRFHAKEVREALIEISVSSDDGKVCNEARSLADELGSFRFLVCLAVWYDILLEVNRVSQILQSVDMQIDVANKLIKATHVFLDSYRENGFEKSLQQAQELASQLEVEPILPQQRLRRQKRMFDYEGVDHPISEAEKRLKVEFFLKIVDTAINSLEERFQLLSAHSEYFGFLYNVHSLKNVDDESLLKHCKDLENFLTSNISSDTDIESADLFSDLRSLSQIVSAEQSTALQALNFICEKKLNECFPTVSVALRILLTLPVSVATGERSFSKLKLIKNYLRSTMSQDRLSDLAMLSIEREVGKEIDYAEIIDKFAAVKARKVSL